ncbi:methyl-accepting chemotaxis protein [Desulfosporosinus sp. FKA]|uniref:methyl-accepting chemotaxis protein n=1 Tax=Desulfosporosinus sp. FKA TaxID=1969834 RepID=UPI000B498217|nr:methyl-accepting chemotaxis protein [Desulfosporosinus sp. FKA]
MKWFYNLKVAPKLIIGFILVAIIAAVVGTVGVLNIQKITAEDLTMYSRHTATLPALASVAQTYQRERVAIRDAYVQKDPNKKLEAINKLTEFDKVIVNSMAAFKTGINDPQAAEAYNKLSKNLDDFAVIKQQAIKDIQANNMDDLYNVLTSARDVQIGDEVQTNTDTLMTLKTNNAKQSSDSNQSTGKTAIITMIGFITGGVILAIVLGIFISRIISNPVNKMVKVADKLADGDLNVNVEADTKDEIGQLTSAFSRMAERINEVMTNIAAASEQVASGSKQVSDSSIALSQGATEQASSIEELTASLEEISTQTKLNAENANEANILADNAKANAVQGNNQMQEMLKAMEEIDNASANISKIIKVIDEIAFQTNILALNAAVEAARAGQHGKGFAVVAEEVRNLAARSANAAKETTDMIEGSIKKVKSGTKIASDTAAALNEIVNGIEKVANLVNNIAVASTEQATGVGQINLGIMQVSQVVQTNSATSEESAAASEELSSQAAILQDMISKFKLKQNTESGSIDRLSPEVLRILENMTEKKTMNLGKDGSFEQARSEAAATNNGFPRISLTDQEFGKY